MAQDIIYKCKEVDFRGQKRIILNPKSGHSRTALLALVNCMLLKGSLRISPEEDNNYWLRTVIMRLRRHYHTQYRISLSKTGVQMTRDEIDNSVEFLSNLFDVNTGFTSNDHIQSSTGRLDIFEHMKVRLLHAWMVQANDAVIFDAVGTDYHPVFMVEHSVPLPELADPLVQNFLNAGVTAFGINELLNNTEEGEIFALFRNGSFHTLTKHNGALYLLNNVINASDKDMWKVFNEQNDGQICNSNFVVESMGENRSEDIQQAQAEMLSQTASSLSERMHKCLRPNCQAEFMSEVNLNRHKQVHLKNREGKMASFSKAELSKHWDKLSLEEAGKILSIKDMDIQHVKGDLLCQVIEKVDNGNEFYSRANRMKAVLHGTKPVSSDKLFTVLDEDSENTAFATDICSCPEESVLSLQLLHLCDLKDVFACCCYFIEKNMVLSCLAHKNAEATRNAKALLQESNNSLRCGILRCTMTFNSEINFNRHRLSHAQTDEMDFMENIDAIRKYLDDLTCDQIRQIVSLKEAKITGFNLKNLQRRLKKIEQDHPLATTAEQLLAILRSSEKMTLEEMLAVFEKASEDTHFSNDIRLCKDDEILAVGDNKCTPSNDVALMSYIIERNLVQSWFHFKESVTSDTQQQLVHDTKSEQSDTAEPAQVQDMFHSKESDTAEPVSMGGDKLLGERIMLEEFIKSNKLTKIYKIRPKDVFKPLKRSLKMLKKELYSQIPKKMLKAVFKLSPVILTRWGRKCARGFVLWIVKNHREGKSWNGSFQLSDTQVVNGQFIISKAAEMGLTLESASADFKSLWELLLVPLYTNAKLGKYPLYFDEFGHDILNLPDPYEPESFIKYEKYLALHFAFMPPLSRSTLLISLYKVYDSNCVVLDHAYGPLNKPMSYDWRDDIRTLPILTDVYYYNIHGHLSPYTSSYFHLLKFSWHYCSHDLDHTKVPGVAQLVADLMVTDLVIGQLLAPSLCELILFIVNKTNMEGRFFRSFQQFESSDDDVFFCVEDDHEDDSADSESSDASDASAQMGTSATII